MRAAELPDGSVVVASRGHGLLRWQHGRVDTFSEPHRLTDAVTRSLQLDDDGSVWITTDGGLDRLRVAPFVTLGTADGLSYATPGLLFADHGGAIWMKDFGHPALFLVDVAWSDAKLVRCAHGHSSPRHLADISSWAHRGGRRRKPG